MSYKPLEVLIYKALKSEYDAIEIYKEMAALMKNTDRSELAQLFDEIASDEMEHVGNLTEMLKTFCPAEYETLQDKKADGRVETLTDISKIRHGINIDED